MILCHEVIWFDKLRSTYCMRPKGHAGKHSVEYDEVTPKSEEVKSKAQPSEDSNARQDN